VNKKREKDGTVSKNGFIYLGVRAVGQTSAAAPMLGMDCGVTTSRMQSRYPHRSGGHSRIAVLSIVYCFR
jgi:hypothetical protein